MSVVTMKQLLEAGVHFGHQTSRWHPKMKPYIYTERNGIHIIDLQKTVEMLDRAYKFVVDLVSQGGIIIFVGTKRQAQETIRQEATRCGMPYVVTRWLGGTLTNFKTIKKRIDRLHELENMDENDERLAYLTKREINKLKKEREKLRKYFEGLKDLKRLPDALYIVDAKKEEIAVREAQKLGIPVVALVDTNCDPTGIDYVIPANDDAIRAIKLLTTVIANAVLEGRKLYEEKFGEIAEGELPAEGMSEEKAAEEVTEESEEEKK